MLRQEFENYFSQLYSLNRIDTEHTIAGRINIRFDLFNEEEDIDTLTRVGKVTERALTIFNTLFKNEDTLLLLLAYEYLEESAFGTSSDYLYQQFLGQASGNLVVQEETVNTRMVMPGKYGENILETCQAKIIMTKATIQDINITNILAGIANREQGLEPAISQSIYFFEPATKTGFHMYDDRGCFALADDPDSIRHVYEAFGSWINEYNRQDIKPYFGLNGPDLDSNTMGSVKVQILSYVDDWNPGWVRCSFIDANGNVEFFEEKAPVVSTDYLSAESPYPMEGSIPCRILKEKDNIAIIDIGVLIGETESGRSVFEVRPDQVIPD